LCHHARLTLETAHELRIARQVLGEDLEGNGGTEGDVTDFDDDSHPTLSDALDELELPWHEQRCGRRPALAIELLEPRPDGVGDGGQEGEISRRVHIPRTFRPERNERLQLAR